MKTKEEQNISILRPAEAGAKNSDEHWATDADGLQTRTGNKQYRGGDLLSSLWSEETKQVRSRRLKGLETEKIGLCGHGKRAPGRTTFR